MIIVQEMIIESTVIHELQSSRYTEEILIEANRFSNNSRKIASSNNYNPANTLVSQLQ